MSEPEFPFLLGQGRYEVQEVFADSGGMGVIYAARDLLCAGNPVLIKTTRYDSGHHLQHFRYTMEEAARHIVQTRKILEWEKKVLVRFRNEGLNNLPSANNFFYDRSRTLKASYQGKVAEYALPQDLRDAEPYLVLERISGVPLGRKMVDEAWRGSLEEHLLTMAREILTIFIKMHRTFEVGGKPAQFLYQDLKPANVLVSGSDYFTLIDFGAVTLKLGDRTTEPTAGCITTGYAAPEGAREGASGIGPAFDLYTLGATLWQAITLIDPQSYPEEFPRLDPALMRGKGVSEALVQIIARALAPDPAQRYGSAAAMRKDIMTRQRELHAQAAA